MLEVFWYLSQKYFLTQSNPFCAGQRLKVTRMYVLTGWSLGNTNLFFIRRCRYETVRNWSWLDPYMSTLQLGANCTYANYIAQWSAFAHWKTSATTHHQQNKFFNLNSLEAPLQSFRSNFTVRSRNMLYTGTPANCGVTYLLSLSSYYQIPGMNT